MPNWNTEQQLAIDARNYNVVVGASAGAGKTTVLIARLVKLVMEDEVSIDQILAMTFTEAAANEMKKRLTVELQKLIHDISINEQQRVRLKEQIGLLQNAKISTIHSFCLSILQNYYYMIGLPLERVNTILDSAQGSLLQKEAMQEALDWALQEADESTYISLLQQFDQMPTAKKGLLQAIDKLATLATTKPNPSLWLEQIQLQNMNIKSMKDVDPSILSMYFQSLAIFATTLQENCNNLYEYMLGHENAEGYLTTLKIKVDHCTLMMKALEEQEYTTFQNAVMVIAKNTLKAKPRGDEEYPIYAEIIKECEDELLKVLFDEEEYFKDYKLLEPLTALLFQLVKHYLEGYKRKKEEVKAIDFADMEHYSLDILKVNNGVIAKKYRDSFYEIMVDEFQDSNDVQDELVRLIKKENNVFRVGDIKQSIYGFRYAKPDLMKGMIKNKGDYDQVLFLAKNYRSKKTIIDFNNHLFDKLMNIKGFDSSYDENDSVKDGIPKQQENCKPIEFHAINKKVIDPDNYITSDDLKADYIVNQIFEKKIREDKDWKDFVVLVRSNAKKEVLRRAFIKNSIPCFIDVKSGFYQSSAVQLVLSSLALIVNSSNDIALCSLANSTFIEKGFTELVAMKLEDSSYYSTLQEEQEPFILLLNQLRRQLQTIRLPDLISTLYNYDSFYHERTNDQEKINLDLLFQKAIQFESQELQGVENFLRYIEQIKDEQTAEAIPIGFDADVVRVMSIHQSKGLQFPVVFLWSTSRMAQIEFKDALILDETLGIGFKCTHMQEQYTTPTLTRLAIEYKKNKEELEEEMRILYVATTRAQNEMIIVDIVDDLDKLRKPLSQLRIFERKGYSSWILGAFSDLNPELFTAISIIEMWTHPKIETIKNSSTSFKMKVKEEHKISILTPSTQKVSARNKILNFEKTNYGFMIGTKMHEMCEVLPIPSWTEEQILEVASQIRFNIKPAQIQQLLQLGNNPFYKELHLGTVYKEYDFMCKYKNEYINGIIDVLFVEEELTIVDFKSDAHIDEESLISNYKEQLYVYKKALQSIYKEKKINTYLYSFSLHKFLEII